ncbi:hypothetical protein E4U41_006742 [Claviceps citrina]|nr:hypothetical protein E4U41_006742 [Claviceps citrina]
MPQKRQVRCTTASSNDPDDDGKPKKRRVSLACDACRVAREKCDGARPRCGACVAPDRPGSYTPATKKRGVQTGYLRTIELSLAWLFDRIPESEQALHRLLAQSAPVCASRALLGKGSAGHHLQKIWNETRARKAIDSLLADNHNVPSGRSDIEQIAGGSDRTVVSYDGGHSSRSRPATSLTTRAMKDLTHAPISERGFSTVLKLPSHWQHLIAVYISYTHYWLPIVCPEVLRSLAASYGAGGIHVDLDGERSGYSRHSELWAALPIGPENLVQILDPRFKYCNSLMSSSSTPMNPSAFLIKLLFLTATIELASHLRPSLLCGFLDMVESCLANFGASRTPPVVSLLLRILRKRAGVGDRWRSAEDQLHNAWQERPESSITTEQLGQQQGLPRETLSRWPVAMGQVFDASPLTGPGSSSGGPFGPSILAGDQDAGQSRSGYQQSTRSDPGYADYVDTPLAALPETRSEGGRNGQGYILSYHPGYPTYSKDRARVDVATAGLSRASPRYLPGWSCFSLQGQDSRDW